MAISFPGTLQTTASTFPIIYLSGLNAAPNTPLPWTYSQTNKNQIAFFDYQYLLGMPFWSVPSIASIVTSTPGSYSKTHGFKFKQYVTTVYIRANGEFYTLTNPNLSGTAPGGSSASGWTYSNPINALSASLDLAPGYILKVGTKQSGDKKYRTGTKSVIFESPEGNVGINTTNPTSTLTVNGDTTVTGGVTATNIFAASATFITLTATSATFEVLTATTVSVQTLSVSNEVYIGGNKASSLGDGKFLPLSGGALTGPLTAVESVQIYDLDSVKFLGEQKIITSSTSTVTATNDYLKIEVNGKIRYLRLFDLEKKPEMLSMVWDTTRVQGDDVDIKTIVLPICSSSFAPSGIEINWGDGVIETRTTPTLTGISHTYIDAGIYQVTITDREIL